MSSRSLLPFSESLKLRVQNGLSCLKAPCSEADVVQGACGVSHDCLNLHPSYFPDGLALILLKLTADLSGRSGEAKPHIRNVSRFQELSDSEAMLPVYGSWLPTLARRPLDPCPVICLREGLPSPPLPIPPCPSLILPFTEATQADGRWEQGRERHQVSQGIFCFQLTENSSS